MFDFGFWELALILIISLIVLGPERLPVFASQLGSFIKKIIEKQKDELSEFEDKINSDEK